MDRNWDILIIGGASGAGKTSISRPLSKLYGVDLVRVDDFQILLEKMTTPESCPAIHYWDTHPNWREEGIDAAVNRLIDVGQVLMAGLTAVINDHIEENIPMILEGDFILPQLSASFNHSRVKSIFVHEPSKEQILQNYLAREGAFQQHRADISHAYGNWLAENCAKYGIQVIEPRPWDSVLVRIIESF
ncbi:MAG: hypothetical protein FWE05_06325 [Defluviitaleaceae bacterium]|nr:hypothetical protein [Defluviitaleaceae bacterium]